MISDSSNTNVANVSVGADPVGVDYDSGVNEIFVANEGDGTLSVMSDSNNAVVATVIIGAAACPCSVAYDSAMKEIFVANIKANTISVVSDSNDTVIATIASPTPVSPPIPTLAPPTGQSPTFSSGIGSWTEKSATPSDCSGDEAAVVNNTIYIFGPTDYAYNPSSDAWTTIAPMLTPRMSFAVAACGNKIYVIGGYDESSGVDYAVNEVYDPATNTWSTAAPLPTSETEMQANTVNGEIYVMGGRTSDTYSTNLTEIYNPAANSWSNGAPMPYPVANAASAVANDNIYVIGGEDDESPPASSQNVAGMNSVNFNQIYNPSTDSWVLGTPIPVSTFDGGAGATTGVMAPEQICVFGNMVGFGETSSQNYAYDPVANSWTSAVPMPYASVGPAVAVVNDLLYLVGDGQNVEQYTPIGWTPDQTYLSETTPPQISVLSPLNQTYKESNVPLVFSVDKVFNWVGYSLDGEPNVTVTGNSTIADMANGKHTLTLYVNDTFGDIGVSQTINFTIAISQQISQSQPFPTTIVAVASITVMVIVVAALSVYYTQRKR